MRNSTARGVVLADDAGRIVAAVRTLLASA
jgi:hypothetical protein